MEAKIILHDRTCFTCGETVAEVEGLLVVESWAEGNIDVYSRPVEYWECPYCHDGNENDVELI